MIIESMPQKRIYEYTAKFESDGEGGYMVTVPAISEIVTGGRTLAEAEEMVKEAIRLCLRVRAKKGEPIPRDTYRRRTTQPVFFTRVGATIR